jgi:hypothetical protein
VDAHDPSDDAADLGEGIELALALAAFGGEVAHQVVVGVAQDIVAVRSVFREIQRRMFEDGDQVGQALDLFLAVAELGGIVEVGKVGELVGFGQRGNDVFVDLIADVGLALQGDHVLETGAVWHGDRGEGCGSVFVADVFDEQQNEDVVFVLAGIHAAA